MDDYKTFIKEVFDKYKCKQKCDLLRLIPIYSDASKPVGYLRPITRDYETTIPGCAAILAMWRNDNPNMTIEPFYATPESTGNWLSNAVIARDDRILFIITTIDGTKIGHIGFSNFYYEEKCCEVDAVLRGEKIGYKGMMTFALNALINWGINVLNLEAIKLRVVNDNSRAIKYYEKVGFNISGKDIDASNTEKHYITMQLDFNSWKELLLKIKGE